MQARLALTDLNRIEAIARDPKTESLPALKEQVAALDIHLTATRTAARPFLWLASRLGWLPSIGPSLRALPPLLNMAVDMAGGGHQALDALDPILTLAGSSGQDDLLAQAVLALSAAAPELARGGGPVRPGGAEARRHHRTPSPTAGWSPGASGSHPTVWRAPVCRRRRQRRRCWARMGRAPI